MDLPLHCAKSKLFNNTEEEKEMKNVLLLLVLMVGSVVSMTAQTQKTLVKSIDLAGANKAVVSLPGEVSSSTWDNDFIRITTYLTVDNMSESIVKQLVLVGRYNIDASLDEATQSMVITMPKIANQVRVKGVALIEHLRFEVQVPIGYTIRIQAEETTGATASNAAGQAL